MMDVEMSPELERVFCPDPYSCLDAVHNLKNSVIGSNRQKEIVTNTTTLLARLYQLLLDNNSTMEMKIEIAVTLGSLARGNELQVQKLINSGIVGATLKCLFQPNVKLMEACLRCLRTVMSRKEAPFEVMYEDAAMIPHLVQLAKQHTASVHECVMTILYWGCQSNDHQDILCENGVLELMTPLLACNIYRVQIPSLNCLAQMCYKNERVSSRAVSCSFNGQTIPDILASLMSRDKTVEMQLSASKCLTYIFRAGALPSTDTRVVYKALPTLVRMCQKDKTADERVEGAETLAYLCEVDIDLQRIASISDHLIPTLADFLKYRAPLHTPNEDGMFEETKSETVNRVVQEHKTALEMKQAAFIAFGSIAANDENIRKRIIETESLMDSLMKSANDSTYRIRVSALRCLHSLSRSVQQLRTTFQDHAAWRQLMEQLVSTEPDEVIQIGSSILCNLLLDFSPSKEHVIEHGVIEILASFTHRDDISLRINGVWGLMNMAFQADQKIKSQILNAIGPDRFFLLLNDSDVAVRMKALGLLRNLLSTAQHIDHFMNCHGSQITETLLTILDSNCSDEIKQQVLCGLANIASGEFAKIQLMSDDETLKKIMAYMLHSNVKLQNAAMFCIGNLVWKDEDGASDRQAKLKDLGIHQLLQQLLSTTDMELFDRTKTTLSQFPSTPAAT